jgi:hypothetical protein
MNIYNGRIVDLQNYRVINGTTVTITNDELVAGGTTQLILEGTNTVTLPAIVDDSTYVELILVNGSTTIVTTIDGVGNRVYSTPNESILLARHNTEYSVVRQKIINKEKVINAGVEFFFSTVNSTTAQLTAGSTFTGTIEDITLYPSLSFLALSDQDMTYTIKFFIDLAGTKQCGERVISTVANERVELSVPINGNYIQVIAKNEGAGSTTTLNVNTAFGTIEANNEIQDDYLRGQATQTATVNNILTPVSGTAPVDVSKYRSFTCQVVSTGTGGTFIFEGSNDGTNFQAIPVYNQALVVRVPIITAITASATQIIYEGACNFKYLRLRIATTITGGSLRAHTVLMHTPLSATSQVVSNGTAANLLATVSGSLTSAGTTTNTPATPTASAINSAASTNATSVKGTAGTIYNVLVSNTGASTRYVKLYNKATAPTVGTDVPVITIAVPTNGTVQANMGVLGHRFATGIGLAITGGAADNDTAAVGANEVKVLTSYI